VNQPRWPTLVAILVFACVVVLLGAPVFSGQWLVGPYSDQVGGFAVRQWAAEQMRATGAVPLWNPMIFGGLPYVATLGHGDVFYPASFIRLLVSADVALGIWFVIHMLLIGIFTYLLLRRMGVTWLGSLVGGLAYQLSGIIVSQAGPGHDGKLAVSTLLPLAFLAIYAAVREKQWWGYGLLAASVGLALLSPHVQMTYYLLLASGLFALYCAFGEPDSEKAGPRIGRLAIALAAVLVGFGVAALQLLPFLEYVPHSPRAESFGDFARSASYGIPWDHVPEFFIAGFSGDTDTYWGSNSIKLHSEYLGLPVIALAILGFRDQRRRLMWWLAGIGLLFLLISLSSSTPFYRLWWSVMPYVKKTRAPGMAFFVVAMVLAMFAGFGATRLERGEGIRHARAWLIAAGVAALMALGGAFGAMAESLAQDQRAEAAAALGGELRIAGLIGAIALGALGLLVVLRKRGKAPAAALMVGLPLLVGLDLWRDGRHFWTFRPPAEEGLYHEDALVQRVRQDKLPFRVLDLSSMMRPPGAYPINVLQGHDIPQVLGYFGFEHRYYDDLLGGQNEWRYLLSSARLWSLLSVRYVITADTTSLPGYRLIMGPVVTAAGQPAYLYEAEVHPPYARVVPGAMKLEDAQVPPTLADPRLPGFDRVVFLPENAPVGVTQLAKLPEPSASRAAVSAWRPGSMTIDLDPAPMADSYLLVSENWYLDWHATVDGKRADVLRGDNTFITVPVSAGARRVELQFRSATYERGKAISILSLAMIIASFVVPFVKRRRKSGG
jgi:hypothetical protein